MTTIHNIWYVSFPHRQKHGRQQQDDRIHQSFIIYGDLWGQEKTDVTIF